MTAQDTQTTGLTPDQDPSQVAQSAASPADANAQLREAYDREKERRQTAEAELGKMFITRLGLEPNEGLGKAILKTYDGDYTYEAVAAYAQEEYNHTAAEAPAVTPETAEQIAQAQAQADQAAASSTPITPPTDLEEVAALEQKLTDEDSTPRDAQASMNAKLGRFIQQNQ
jgi:hypothetical protein